MAYDHTKNIGNQGDVVKHAALACALKWALTKKTQTPFLYAESHAGRAEYILPESGSWRFGIGAFIAALKAATAEIQEVVAPYVSQFATLGSGQRYLGSAAIAFRMISDQGQNALLLLHETDPSPADDLTRYFHAFSHVAVRRSDGYAGLRKLRSGSLALVDPPNLDTASELRATLEHLSLYKIPFIAWTPRTAGRFADGWREASPSTGFWEATSMFARFRVRWSEWNSQGMKGCQLTCSADLETAVRPVVDVVRTLMTWADG